MSSQSTLQRRARIVVQVMFKADVQPSTHTESELDILTAAAGSIFEKSPGLRGEQHPPPPSEPPPVTQGRHGLDSHDAPSTPSATEELRRLGSGRHLRARQWRLPLGKANK